MSVRELITTGEIDYSDEKVIEVLKNTVAKDATKEEFILFAHTCKVTGLNPLLREIWFIKSKGYTNKRGEFVEGKPQIMVGIGGYLRVANTHPEYDGLEQFITVDEKGKLISATCSVFRKDRNRPHTVTVYLDEYYQAGFNGNESIWDKKQKTMLLKVAKSHALKESFPILANTLISEETDVDMSEIQSITPRSGSFTYRLPDAFTKNKKNRLYLQTKGVVFVPEQNVWRSPESLGAQFEPSLVKEGEIDDVPRSFTANEPSQIGLEENQSEENANV